MTLLVEWRRENPKDGPHGQVHLMPHERGTRREEVALCGVDTSSMRKQTTPFRRWEDVGCQVCLWKLAI